MWSGTTTTLPLNRKFSYWMQVSFQYYCMRRMHGLWKKSDEKALAAFEMRCYRRLLRVRWQDFQTNESIRSQLSRQYTIVDRIRRRHLEPFGHVCRMPDNRLLKKVLFGMAEGDNYQGRPMKEALGWRYTEVVQHDVTLQEASHHAQDRVKWRTFIPGPYGSWTTRQEKEEEDKYKTTVGTICGLVSTSYAVIPWPNVLWSQKLAHRRRFTQFLFLLRRFWRCGRNFL